MEEKKRYKKSEKTRELLINAGLKIMQEKGYENTNIRDICNEANMSIGAFYGQFKNKADLLAEHYGSSQREATWWKEKLEGGSAVEKILVFVRNYAWLNVGTEVEHLKVILAHGTSWAPINEHMYDPLLDTIREGQSAGELVSEISAEEIYHMLMTFMRGCIYDWCLMDGSYDLESRMLTYISMLLVSFTISNA